MPSFLLPSPEATDPGPQSRQIWRTNLVATEPYWAGTSPLFSSSPFPLQRRIPHSSSLVALVLIAEWYAGLSSRFLTAKCARLLVLAGQERLDKELMVGQM